MKTRLLAILLALSLVLSLGVGLNVSAAATEPFTFMDFETGDSIPLYNTRYPTQMATVAYATLNDGNRVFDVGNTTMFANCGNDSPYGNCTVGNGFLAGGDAWTATARPTKVSFKLKMGNVASSGATQKTFSFYPVFLTPTANSQVKYYTSSISFAAYRDQIQFTNNNTHYLKEINNQVSSDLYYHSTIPYVNETASSLTNENADTWNVFTITYDWTKFTANDGYQLSYVASLTDTAGHEVKYTTTLKADTEKALNVTFNENSGYGFGFYSPGGYSEDTTNVCHAVIDDLSVESYDCVTGEVYPKTEDEPVVDYNPVINGATIKREGSQDLRFNCEFGDIREDKEVAEYGLILTFKQYIDNGDVTADDMVADSTNEYVRVIKSTDVSNVAKGNEFYANVGNIYPEAYGYRYSARVYVKYADGTTIDYSEVLNRSVISVAKAMSKFAYEKQLAGIGDIVSAVDGDSVTWTYDPNTDNGATILDWIQTNQQAIVDAYNAQNQ